MMGVALAERDSGRNRLVITVIGDGSFQYSVQSIWSAAQLHLPMLILVLRYGCDAARLEDIGEIKKAAAKA